LKNAVEYVGDVGGIWRRMKIPAATPESGDFER